MTTITYLGIILFISLSLWIIYGAIYRLYFSPIAKFPGSKLAALTLWYEFYFNVIRDGQWIWEIKRMHEEYGPIVRINPYELHIDDLEYYDELYAGSTRKREKYLWFVSSGGSPGSSFETIAHDLHRLRRNAVNPFFSKRSITAMEPIIKSKISLLSNILHSHFITVTGILLNSRKQVGGVLNHEDIGGRQNTIFHELRDSKLLPPQEKSLNRLADEGNILIGAGGETTAQTLAVLFYHLLDNPKMLSRLKDEIGTLNKDITWGQLEKLPFLVS
ncbi:hypothetical protein NHQ30_010244 [Ciborinia camelliae]|nr:hypothetical protein NHQ30_010244 [Ciborinia camelliae]